MRNHVANYFGLSTSQPLVTITVNDAAMGRVRVNSITISEETAGLTNPSQPYPWSGIYFHGVPIEIEAIPLPRHRFTGWQELPGEPSTLLNETPTANIARTAIFEQLPSDILIHYWSFNVTGTLLSPTFTVGGASLTILNGPNTGVLSGTGQSFGGENARIGDPTGAHLRVNDPLGATMTLALPTRGFAHPVLRFETRRSGQGAGRQLIEYTLDGVEYSFLGAIEPPNGVPTVFTTDFGTIPGSFDNPDFGVRITFVQGSGGLSGNNRFDNITVDAVPLNLLVPTALGDWMLY